MGTPELWLIAGPNGAGKTTAVQRSPISDLLPDIKLLNADDQTLKILRRKGYDGFADAPADQLRAAFVEAADWTVDEVNAALREGRPVGVETVLSTDKYRPIVEEVVEQDGLAFMIYVALRSPELARARVEARVRRGGHDVPADRIAARWHRSIEQLPWFAARAHWFWVFDNSDSDLDRPPLLIAEGGQGTVTMHHPDVIPEITAALATVRRER